MKYYVTLSCYNLRNNEVGSGLDNFNKSFSTRQEAIAYFEEMKEYLENLTFSQMLVYVEKDTSKIVLDCRDEEDREVFQFELAMPEEKNSGDEYLTIKEIIKKYGDGIAPEEVVVEIDGSYIVLKSEYYEKDIVLFIQSQQKDDFGNKIYFVIEDL